MNPHLDFLQFGLHIYLIDIFFQTSYKKMIHHNSQ